MDHGVSSSVIVPELWQKESTCFGIVMLKDLHNKHHCFPLNFTKRIISSRTGEPEALIS